MRRFESPLLAAAILAALMTSGCAILNTRPGDPDSYLTGSFLTGPGFHPGLCPIRPHTTAPSQGGTETYDQHATALAAYAIQRDQNLACQLWSTNPEDFNSGTTMPFPGQNLPIDFLVTRAPLRIWEARGVAWNRHLEYLAASYKAGHIEDELAVPLFGAAIGTAAAGIAQAGPTGVAAAGLAGTSLAAGFQYLQPNKDLSTDQTATSHLLCIVTRSQPLLDQNVMALYIDRAALKDLMTTLAGEESSTAHDAAQAAGTKAMQALSYAIDAYETGADAIYSTIAAVDDSAKTANPRSLDYSAILSSLSKAAANAQAKNDAQATLTTSMNAAGADKKASHHKGGKHKGTASTCSDPVNLNIVAPPDDKGKTPSCDRDKSNAATSRNTQAEVGQTMPPPAAGAEGGGENTVSEGRGGSNDAKAESTSALLMSDSASLYDKVNELSYQSLQDIPNPNYATTIASIRACATGGSVDTDPVAPSTSSTTTAPTE